MGAVKKKEFVFDEIKHLAVAKQYLRDGKELKDLCKRLKVTIKKLYELGKAYPKFGFIIQRINSYSYIPEGEKVYHVEVPWISKFDPHTHVNEIIDLSQHGKTIAQICTVLKISRVTYDNWRGNHKVFEDAHNYSRQCFQAYWEDIMQRGMQGEIDGFNASTITFFLRNQCKDDYADVKNIATSSTNTYAFLTDEDLNRRLLAKMAETKLLDKIPAMRDTEVLEEIEIIDDDDNST